MQHGRQLLLDGLRRWRWLKGEEDLSEILTQKKTPNIFLFYWISDALNAVCSIQREMSLSLTAGGPWCGGGG